jgi:hypothetical protein
LLGVIIESPPVVPDTTVVPSASATGTGCAQLPSSTVHVVEQPSFGCLLPSSQSSPGSCVLLPQSFLQSAALRLQFSLQARPPGSL